MDKKILIIDDSKTARREISKVVTQQGFKPFEADNGKWGHELLRNIGLCGLIFCDVTMPEMNGLEFLQALRNETSFANIPVIMMASDLTEENKKAFQNLQVTAWLNKPFKEVQVKGLLQHFAKASA